MEFAVGLRRAARSLLAWEDAVTKTMSEIAERLRAEETRMERLFDLVTQARDRHHGDAVFTDLNQIKHAVSGRDPVLTLAADEIDRLAAKNAALREERDRLREALGQIIDCDHHNHSDGPPPRYVEIARAARAALSKGER